MTDFLTVMVALTDSVLLRTLALAVALTWVGVALIRFDRRMEQRRRARDLAKFRAQVAAGRRGGVR